jgi:hypothetical protein
MELAQLATSPQEPFGWDRDEVAELFGRRDGPNAYNAKNPRQKLPFRVVKGEFYLVNPADDSDAPFWIGECTAVGTVIFIYILRQTTKTYCDSSMSSNPRACKRPHDDSRKTSMSSIPRPWFRQHR